MPIKLLPHQINTIKFLENDCINQHGILVYHYLGTGKTITGLAWLYHILIRNNKSEYLIVCPDLIKNSWMTNAQHLGFNLKIKNIINYSELSRMIELKDKQIENKYLILDEVHNIVDIIKWQISPSNGYLDINNYLTSTKKNLLLSGTPFNKNFYDISIIINLCTKNSFMPIDKILFNNKFRDETIFNQNKKNLSYFNWIKPSILRFHDYPMDNYIIPSTISKIGFNYSIFYWFWILQNKVIEDILSNLFKLDKEQFFINVLESNIGKTLDKFNLNKLLSIDKNSKVRSYIDNNLNVNQAIRYLKNTQINKKENYSTDLKNKYLQFAKSMLINLIIWKIINYIYDKIGEYFYYQYRDPYDLNNNINIDYDKLITSTKRYISYYKYDNNSDYADIKYNDKPIISLLSISNIFLSLKFLFGKVNIEILSFITQKSKKELELDLSFLLNFSGIKNYGRCISNLPDFIDKIIEFDDNFSICKKTGQITFNNFSNEVIIKDSSSKIKEIGNYIRTINNKKILIYSDYIEQGSYLLSGYLTANKIPHLYLNKHLSLVDREKILNLYNKTNDFFTIILDKDSKEGISLFKVEEVHFLEPPIDLGVKDQVIGRSIRYRSHNDLPLDRRIVNIYIHISTFFEDIQDTCTFLDKIKDLELSKIIINPIKKKINELKDDWRIRGIINQIQKKEFESELQTTFHHYIDSFLGINIEYSIQGKNLYGDRQSIHSQNTQNKNSKKKKNIDPNELVVLSIDEQCYQNELTNSRNSKDFIYYIKENSIISENFDITDYKDCNKKKDSIKKFFNPSLKSKKSMKSS